MNSAYLTAFAGLLGALLGGLTSFVTSWSTLRAQILDRNRNAERDKREQLFNAFIDEASRIYGDALIHQRDDVSPLVKLYSIVGHMRLVASTAVVSEADLALETIIRTYLEPNRSLHELSALAQHGEINFLVKFGEACRRELDRLESYS
jgi:hypothetical protein